MDTIFQPKLVINADDFGWFQQRDAGIIEGFETGAISSTSAIANGNYLEESLNKIKDCNYGVGLHLNLTDGPPVYKENIAANSLVGKYMWYPNDYEDQIQIDGFHGLFPLHSMIKQNKIKEIDLENEIRAQIARFITLRGKLPTHIDGHKHIQMIPLVAKILGCIMTREFGIYKVRFSFDESEKLSKDMKFQYEESIKIYKSYGINSTDYFFGKFGDGKFSKENIIKSLDTFRNKLKKSTNISVEMMCHVGYPSVNPPKCFSSSQQRVKELRILQDDSLQNYIRNNYKLESYEEIENQEKIKDKTLREILQINPKKQLILSYCNLNLEEDCLDSLDNILDLLKNTNDVYFVQVKGQQFDKNYLQQYVNKLIKIKHENQNIKDRIIYVHTLEKDQIIKSLNEVDIFLSFSPNESSTQLEILKECLSKNIICIARNTKLNQTIIQNEQTGLLLSDCHNIKNRCLTVLSNKDSIASIIKSNLKSLKISQNQNEAMDEEQKQNY
ncbi:UPF0249 YdjC-like protein (macronuclear) [Tetrahymena thermophila SB210]|uniref:Carbohydrate deacetylase n=1 Tax=Tetrahymena thermophila (strain SB210) TaxID=312017 RepID=Q24CC0_TETTS|nr:UPF0249 YdjC-like protein [Tetrahymena thermophila SB210]EAS05454.1 UPF0249 YdjC-like protein [Tetrahymena thermophila SB210]|eukprot:XP_001025699.1 UPF0249 YdjC-like protein [Tetrahymena thermophila SB210]